MTNKIYTKTEARRELGNLLRVLKTKFPSSYVRLLSRDRWTGTSIRVPVLAGQRFGMQLKQFMQ